MQTGTQGDGKSKASLGTAPSSHAQSDHGLLWSVPVSNRHQGSWKNTPRSGRVHPSTKPPRDRRLPRGLRELLGLSDFAPQPREHQSAALVASVPLPGHRGHSMLTGIPGTVGYTQNHCCCFLTSIPGTPRLLSGIRGGSFHFPSPQLTRQGTSNTPRANPRQAFPALSAYSH